MKMLNKKPFRIIIVLTIFLGNLILMSCNKDDLNNTQHHLTSKSLDSSISIPYFSSKEVLEDALDSALSYDTITDLLAFEALQGRNSIGAESDFFYELIDFDKFTTSEDILDYVRNNNNFLDTIMFDDSEIGIVPKYSYTPYRYVANSKGMFAVGSYVYKIFKSCIVAVENSNTEKLIDLKENDLAASDTSIFFFLIEPKFSDDATADHETCNKCWHDENSKTTSSSKITIKLQTSAVFYDSYGYKVETTVNVKSYNKCMGFWWLNKHNITCDCDVYFHRASQTGDDWSVDYQPRHITKLARSLWIGIESIDCNWSQVNSWHILFNRLNKFYHYYNYTITASYPGFPQATLSK